MMMGPATEQLVGSVSRETTERLDLLVSLVTKWNPTVNLVSRSTLAQIWERHIADSAQLFPLRPEVCSHWVDLGSGGGFPGLVIAILFAEHTPDVRVSLVESDQRKAAFLREASRLLAVGTNVLCDRSDALEHLRADVVSARALAPLTVLCDMAYRHLKPEGVALYMKGRGHAAELKAAKRSWRFALTSTQSKTDPGAAILRLSTIRKAH